MAAATAILSDKLHEYPQQNVIDGSGGDSAAILDDCLNSHDGVLQLLHRYAGRTFCTPGKRLRLDAESYYPDYMNGTGLDEIWMCCTVPIVTGVIDTRTNKAPFREGEAHVLTPNGQVISLQDLISANPETVMGEKITAFSKALYGDPTWPIVSKKFDNLNPIPHHLHWSKWEVYDINSFDNPGVSPSHYHTTAMGLYPFVTKDQFLACMKRFGKGEYNGVRHLSPHTMMHIDNGFVMPNGVLHSPTNLCTHELHVTMDEHFLAEDLTLDGRIGAAAAFYACREQDYPKDKHEDWEYLLRNSTSQRIRTWTSSGRIHARQSPPKNSKAMVSTPSGSFTAIFSATRSARFSDSPSSQAEKRISAPSVPRCSTRMAEVVVWENSQCGITRI
ncbi:MAG: hypothetical protein R3C01_08505 [Planctomycetaceae bacterium]